MARLGVAATPRSVRPTPRSPRASRTHEQFAMYRRTSITKAAATPGMFSYFEEREGLCGCIFLVIHTHTLLSESLGLNIFAIQPQPLLRPQPSKVLVDHKQYNRCVDELRSNRMRFRLIPELSIMLATIRCVIFCKI